MEAARLHWTDHQQKLLDLARRQLFFVGGAPRSGTTWLQYLLDSHADICCHGEGLLMEHLAWPLDKMMAKRHHALEHKNRTVFGHSDGYPLPEGEETECLLGTAILLELERQCGGKTYRAIGEKTPANVFFFPRAKRLFPHAKFIGIARDPRDVLSSSWHFFQKSHYSGDQDEPKASFVRNALSDMQKGGRAILALAQRYPNDCMIVTYERMVAMPATMAARLFQFLGVSDSDDVVADCVARTSFAALTSGRPAGVVQEGAFFRKGVVGDWRSTFTPKLNKMILQELGWMFPYFGWEP
jgi:hypothetical protein